MNPINLPNIDNSWTLFLDRDGVINKKIEGGYVTNINDFKFLPRVLEAICILSHQFHKIIIVTNQQGIGKGIMSCSDLENIHQHLKQEVSHHKGRIDAIYCAPNLAKENNLMRKPNIGMALAAQKDYCSIDLKKSIMVGDSVSDMLFAKNSSMFGVFIGKNKDYYSISSLFELSQLLKNN